MGGGGSKQADLERYGQLLTPGERQALETTFHEVAGSPDASSFTDKQLQVYLADLLYPRATSKRVSRGVFLALGGGGRGGATTLEFPDFVQGSSHLLRGSLTQRSQRLHTLCSGGLDLLREALVALLARACQSEPSSSWPPSFPHSLDSILDFLTRPLTEGGVADGRSLSVQEIESWLASSPAVGHVLDVAFGRSLYQRAVGLAHPPPEIAALAGLPQARPRCLLPPQPSSPPHDQQLPAC
jgi:hypothetical protein